MVEEKGSSVKWFRPDRRKVRTKETRRIDDGKGDCDKHPHIYLYLIGNSH